jgi:hypothetical protein
MLIPLSLSLYSTSSDKSHEINLYPNVIEDNDKERFKKPSVVP